jgi:hypothetical protein
MATFPRWSGALKKAGDGASSPSLGHHILIIRERLRSKLKRPDLCFSHLLSRIPKQMEEDQCDMQWESAAQKGLESTRSYV